MNNREKVKRNCILFHQRYNSFFDWIYPSVPKKFPEQIKAQKLHDKKLLEEDLESVKTLYDKSIEDTRKTHKELLRKDTEEKNRTDKVEGKLATLFVLSVVSATFVSSTGKFISSDIHWIVLIPMGYCILQLICALSAVIEGMKRQSYQTAKIKDLISATINIEVNQIVNLLKNVIKGQHYNQQVTNKKVTALAIAHCAVRNFLFGLFTLFFFSLFFFQSPKNYLHEVAKNSKKISTNLGELKNIKELIVNYLEGEVKSSKSQVKFLKENLLKTQDLNAEIQKYLEKKQHKLEGEMKSIKNQTKFLRKELLKTQDLNAEIQKYLEWKK